MGVERSEGAGGGFAGAAAALNGSPTDRPEEPPNKRPKLILAEDASALRKRILEYKLLRLKNLRERSTELLKEQYFLEAGGNMIDYVAWRKRPPAPALAAYVEARRTGAGAESAATLDTAVETPPSAPEPQAGADEVVEKARAEAAVAARIAALARGGLWAERRLPRVLEPPRPKTHWDYLLEEMAWLAQDFAHERKWKKQAAKKCARAVQKYFQDKALAAQKAEKAQELQLKKIAAFAAKEIRTFWANIEKVVEWKRSVRVERARKQALDEQLSYIVDRTERYSRQLAANLHPERPPPSDDEFQPRGDSDDDEETIAAAERDDPADHSRELDALRRESRLDLGELLPAGYLPEHSPPPSDYGGDEDSADDESTIDEQERAERPDETAAELAALRSEADLDIDELLRRYPRRPVGADADAEVDLDAEPDEDEASSASSETESGGSERAPLETLVADEADGEDRVEAAASLAASLQPTGTTLSDTTVGTPVPRLLRHTLREYQQVGLHWLATMHARRLNGILADEMGLGKTIQTIALLAHLALERQDWGPHLVVAPTSLVLNWEYEFKKWCPAFKLLTYYGTIKERKLKRVGWTKANSFHVCITSYKLVVQDHQSFRRKRWKYLILDEAQNIKNFKSQRWQMLLNFQTERRLLLTGTPLQNSLLELWSLMHFLMPSVFASHSEFREWFAPVAGIAEGATSRQSDALLRRLHEVLRPFLLRRLKADVERQLPRKHEHVLLCRLAKRQRFLYDDFMSRAKTKESLASGNLLSVINVLMQLRKVCNHPDLFEPRPVTSPLHLTPLSLRVPALALLASVDERRAAAARLGGDLASLELHVVDAFAAHRARHLAPPRRLVEELAERPAPTAPRPPPAALRLHLRLVPRAPPSRLTAVAPQPPRLVTAPPRTSEAPAPVVPHPREGGASGRLEAHRASCMRRAARVNERRCWRLPLFGADLRAALSVPPPPPPFAPKTVDDVLAELHDVIDRFGICWAPCRAEPPSLFCGGGEGARAWRRREIGLQRALAPPLRRALAQVHAPAQRQAVAFPHPRLLQYDCGKLQTLDGLLRRLRAGAHRVLIFTQMTRVLDVLEAFLSMHGHTYLRLDGATRVDLRQPLVDRFNTDPRIFAFILSTRSGGVGLNLTGADSVVFYDSDWNPTMDAQAQDRCHRIGQTRDVHVFRLVTAATVEENILRKAEQKRALGHLAIEDGHFTTSYLRDTNVRELFGGESGGAAADGGELESALAACEDEADAAAAVAARAEAHRDLAEFDESVPLDDVAEAPVDAPDECVALVKQLSPVERYAMRVVESGEAATEAERAALEDMRRQLRDWEKARAALREGPEATERDRPDRPSEPRPDDDEDPLTYDGEDARTKVWIGASPAEDIMPMWGPPTPPSGDGDVYCDSWARALYRPGAASESLLPPVRWRDPRAARSPRRLRPAPRAPVAPPSLFGLRPRTRPRAPPPAARDPAVPPPEWSPCEDAALRRALRSQRLPAEPPAALAPNWEWLAELVNEVSRAYRSPRACRDRHDALADPDRARRKHRKPPQARRRPDEETPRPPLSRLEAMREAAERRRAAPKRRHDDAAPRNPKHAALLADQGLDYDAPPTPMEVATRRAERMAKEKLKGGQAPTGAGPTGTPQRVVVAAGGVQAGKAERRDAVPPRSAHLVYRQPSPAARHHLKILHHAPPHSQSIVTSGSGTSVGGVVASVEGVSVGGGGAAALRTLQLQQLALRRAARPHQHVVLAHLAPAQTVAAQPQPAVQQTVAASQPTTAPAQQSTPDSRH